MNTALPCLVNLKISIPDRSRAELSLDYRKQKTEYGRTSPTRSRLIEQIVVIGGSSYIQRVR